VGPDPKGTPLALGDRIEFEPEHVIDTLPPASWKADAGDTSEKRG
jgi:hypothetical protein